VTRQQLLDPCINIRIGAAILADADRQAACIFNTGRAGCRNGYPDKVLAAAAGMARVEQAAAPPPAPSPQPPARPACGPLPFDLFERAAHLRACAERTPDAGAEAPAAGPHNEASTEQ